MFEVGMMVKSKTMAVDTFGFITRVSNVTNRGAIVCVRWFDHIDDEWYWNSIDAHQHFEVINNVSHR